MVEMKYFFVVFKSLFFILLLGPANQMAIGDEVSTLILQCEGCHAGGGLKADPLAPNIRGQHFFYLYTQLKDYKAERRSHSVMTSIAAELSKKEMKALANHYSEQAWVKVESNVDGRDDARASEILASGGRNACLKCHANFIGLNGTPRLAGQKSSYLRETMQGFKQKTRLNVATKNTLFKEISDSDISALANYIGDQ